MKYKHTADLIYFLRNVYCMCERAPSSPNMIGLDIGTGEPVEIKGNINEDSVYEVIGNLCWRGTSKYSEFSHHDRFPLAPDEKDGFYAIMHDIVDAVNSGIDSKELCDSMIAFVHSTKFYMEKATG